MKHLSLILVVITLMSCNQSKEKSTDTAPLNIDSLTATFLAGWNNKDSVAIINTIADNAIVMNDSLIHEGLAAISNKWISGGVKVLSNIKTTSMVQDNDDKIAYDGGTYTLDLTPPGGLVLKEKGNYNLVWTKQQNGMWKLTLVHIEDITRLPDIR